MAVQAGATILTGGTREGNCVAPTVLTGVPREATLATEEVFGPVLTLERFDTIDQAMASVNDSRYGLQTGVFTATSSWPSGHIANWRSVAS